MNDMSHIHTKMNYQKKNQGNWVLYILTTSLRIVGAHTGHDDLIGIDFSALIQGYYRPATSHGTRLNADIKCEPCMHDDTYKTTRKSCSSVASILVFVCIGVTRQHGLS